MVITPYKHHGNQARGIIQVFTGGVHSKGMRVFLQCLKTLLSTEVVTVRQRVSTGWKKPHVKYAAKKMKQRPHFEAVLSGGKQKKIVW